MPTEIPTFCNTKFEVKTGVNYPLHLYIYPHVIMDEDKGYPIYLECVPATVDQIATTIVNYEYEFYEHGYVTGLVTTRK